MESPSRRRWEKGITTIHEAWSYRHIERGEAAHAQANDTFESRGTSAKRCRPVSTLCVTMFVGGSDSDSVFLETPRRIPRKHEHREPGRSPWPRDHLSIPTPGGAIPFHRSRTKIVRTPTGDRAEARAHSICRTPSPPVPYSFRRGRIEATRTTRSSVCAKRFPRRIPRG
jgi:hypothetical protein